MAIIPGTWWLRMVAANTLFPVCKDSQHGSMMQRKLLTSEFEPRIVQFGWQSKLTKSFTAQGDNYMVFNCG
ncbi:hypothetical protein AQUCO_01200142v1 [Aquilegia coerulea]|uniref:Uncharacterized protein n=1 Tax=Aquilegia coerulea TaxID=218851 RepID=A0A2G5E4N2_AQUCA|nr:hypothetical protein AQUCO_01200142v1 [Aquilegia coerulea]